jgi:cardiolipin synthase A/B
VNVPGLGKWKRPAWVAAALLVVEWAVKIVALGVVPENRRPGSASAWLLLVLFVPVVGVPAFLLLGSPLVRGRRERIQGEANRLITDQLADVPLLPKSVAVDPGLAQILQLNRTLTALPAVVGRSTGLHDDYEESIAAMTAAVRTAKRSVHVEIYIMAWDDTTDAFFTAMADAVRRGVAVRVLYDHLGSIRYPGYREMLRKMTAAGFQWHPMMPIDPLRGRWRRPDLRNHRKLLVVDGRTGFMGSQNMIDSSYLAKKNIRAGRHWHDLNIGLTGPIVDALAAVFAIDWYTETGETLPFNDNRILSGSPAPKTGESTMQLVPSGPGFPTEPNLRLFVSLIHRAQRHLAITSPYFVPDESLLYAITTAAHRGVHVELFVSEQADQFMVQHAQRSYYRALLEAGVQINLYPKPTVLHAKHFTVDDEIGVIGSSNMDMRSFELDYEITLVGFGGPLVHDLHDIQDRYRASSKPLTLEEWNRQPWYRRYVDNVLRLTSDLQ